MRTQKKRTQTPDLAAVLFGGYHRQLLALLLLRPEHSFHVREVERLTGVPVGSAHRELKRFAEAGLLTRTRVGNQVRYQASRACPIFEELAGIFRKTVGMADVIRDALLPLEREIDAAFVFGSVAQGAEGPHSDVDVMLVGSAPFASVVEALHMTRERLRRDVNPVVMPTKSFRSKLKSGDRFVSRVMSEPKIMLMGSLDELGKPAKDRTA